MSLTLQREGGGQSVSLPPSVSALLLENYPNAASDLRAASSPGDHTVTPPTDVLLLGQSVAGGPLMLQTEFRVHCHLWRPSDAPASAPDHVVFIGQPVNGDKFPYQMTTPTTEAKAEEQRKADFDKKQAQLMAALASNKAAYEDAKQTGEVSDVGALAIERDRIEEELALPFVPRLVRPVDEVAIAPLSIEIPFGYFQQPETGLLFQLIKRSCDLQEQLKHCTPKMMINGNFASD